MSYSTRTRDRYRLAVASGTGAGIVATLAAAGWIAGTAADAFAREQATTEPTSGDPKADRKGQGARTRADRPLRQRPTRTRVTVRYVTDTTGVAVGSGGTVIADNSGPGSSSSGGSSGSSGDSSGPGPAPAPPPPPAPEPPSTPTSGS